MWDTRGHDVDSVHSGGRYYRGIDDHEIDQTIRNIIDKLSLNSYDRMLDIGLSGAFTEEFMNAVFLYAGLDYSLSVIKNIQKTILVKKNNILVTGEAASLPFSDNSFNKILCNSVFFYFFGNDKIKCMFDEIKRVSQKNSLVLLGDVEFKNDQAPFLRSKTFYHKRRITEPLRSFRIWQEFILEGLGLRNRYAQKELFHFIDAVGVDLRLSPHLPNIYKNKFDIVFKIVK